MFMICTSCQKKFRFLTSAQINKELAFQLISRTHTYASLIVVFFNAWHLYKGRLFYWKNNSIFYFEMPSSFLTIVILILCSLCIL